MKKKITDEMSVRELGERVVVSEITRAITPSDFLLDGFGHDAAFVDLPRQSDEVLVINTDRSGLNAAYKFGLAGPECIGDLGVSHAVSDVVVAGGVPRALTIAMLLPPDTTIGFVRRVMDGAQLAAERYGAFIVGGDTKQSTSFAMVVTAVGTAKKEERVLRSRASPGDALVVTGYLGSMLLGMMVYGKSSEKLLPLEDAARAIVDASLIRQRPPFRLGRAISGARLAHAGIDISDGLPGAIHSLCDASGVGALIDETLIPLNPELGDLVARTGLGPLELSAAGGDWQYLYSLPHERLAELGSIAKSHGEVVRVIGTIVKEEITAVRSAQGTWWNLERMEHDSFADRIGGMGYFDSIQSYSTKPRVAADQLDCERSWKNRK